MLLFLLLPSIFGFEYPCIFEDNKGRFYDLSPLSICNQSGYQVDTPDGQFTINFCNSVSGCGGVAGICQNGFYSCGSANAGSFANLPSGQEGFIYTYEGGDGCSGGVQRKSIFTVNCNPSANQPILTFISEKPQCVYNFQMATKYACQKSKAPQIQTCPLKVFLVPHTHDDVGWLKTIEDYYNSEVKNIIDTAVSALIANPERKFMYVEQAFFHRWWTDSRTSNQQRADLKQLVANGQWEFVIGGWVMQDEACTTYGADIEQMTLGHQFLYSTFGVRPTKGWQIDPFGASSVTPLLNKLSGFDAHLIDRVTNKNLYMTTQSLDFNWRSSSQQSSSIFTELMGGGGYCDFIGILPFGNDPVNPSNVKQYADAFVNEIHNRAGWYRTPNILAQWGCDFAFQNATAMFHSMDQVMSYLQDQFNQTHILVKYANLSEYFASVARDAQVNGITWPENEGSDFFPYNTGGVAWWTGYFSSRTQLKGWVRRGESVAHALEQLYSIGSIFLNFNNASGYAHVDALRVYNGNAQHHDGVTGTSNPNVVLMYQNDLINGIRGGLHTSASILNAWLPSKSTQSPQLHGGIGQLANIAAGQTMAIVFYNSLGWNRTEILKIPVNHSDLAVVDATGKTVPSQVSVAVGGNVTTRFHLFFEAGSPALGYATYFVTAGGRSAVVATVEKVPAADIVLENSCLQVTIDQTTGRISKVFNKLQNVLLPVDQNINVYTSSRSGAYMFAPTGKSVPVSPSAPTNVRVRGPIVDEVAQSFGSWAKQTVRLFHARGNVDIEGQFEIVFDLGPLPSHTEVVTVFKTPIKSAGALMSDDNGFEFNPRTYDYQRGIGGNYYPTIYASYIADTWSQITLYGDRSHGVSSQNSGEIELMVHRNPAMGDGAGPGLTDTDRVYPSIRIGVTNPQQSAQQLHSQPYLQNFHPALFSALVSTSVNNWISGYRLSETFLGKNKQLPINIHFLSANDIKLSSTLNQCPPQTSCILLRFTHLYTGDEHSILSDPVTIDLRDLFSGKTISKISEVTLTANRRVGPVPGFKFTISPKEIRSFIAEFPFAK